jgi:hypothetical protein
MKRCFLMAFGLTVRNQTSRSEQRFQTNNTEEHYE